MQIWPFSFNNWIIGRYIFRSITAPVQDVQKIRSKISMTNSSFKRGIVFIADFQRLILHEIYCILNVVEIFFKLNRFHAPSPYRNFFMSAIYKILALVNLYHDIMCVLY